DLLAVHPGAVGPIGIRDRDMLDLAVGHALDLGDVDALVNDPVVDDGDVGDVARLVDVARILAAVIGVAVEAGFEEALGPHKVPEIDADADADVATLVAIARIEARIRRQRRPADRLIALAEGDPRPAPYPPRDPDPAVLRIRGPTAVVEGPPTPGQVRHPGPPVVVRIDPVAVAVVGPPPGCHARRMPDFAILRAVDPVAVGGQFLMEGIDVDAGLHRLRQGGAAADIGRNAGRAE